MNLFDVTNAVNQSFKDYNDGKTRVDIKREDLLHELVSGNKLRKLKYNIL
ncbi:1-aminocyclopropane-1-carboxylate deaminase/D-cysteine desulfhydrase, partial [Nonlabens mediterrranea]|nr:1-aminocyclopropane-1-carboxylate deaminase/D-cysteine desulfhydrase [Nonlabens mediterrranea]